MGQSLTTILGTTEMAGPFFLDLHYINLNWRCRHRGLLMNEKGQVWFYDIPAESWWGKEDPFSKLEHASRVPELDRSPDSISWIYEPILFLKKEYDSLGNEKQDPVLLSGHEEWRYYLFIPLDPPEAGNQRYKDILLQIKGDRRLTPKLPSYPGLIAWRQNTVQLLKQLYDQISERNQNQLVFR
jgi:hypothetical protein